MVANWQLCQDEKRAGEPRRVCVKVAPKKEEDCFAVPAEFRDASPRLPLPPEAVSTLIWRTWRRGRKKKFPGLLPRANFLPRDIYRRCQQLAV